MNPVEVNEDDENSFMASSDEESEQFLGEISINTVTDNPKWMVSAKVTKCNGGKNYSISNWTLVREYLVYLPDFLEKIASI